MDKEKKFCVYMHINKQNNKKYIGITSQDVKDRWKNGHGYKNCTKFWRAIQKYGWDGFEHLILYENISEQKAFEMEINLIQFYNTNGEDGYNISSGGSCGRLGCTNKIYQYDKNGYFIREWNSLSEIELYYNINETSAIYTACVHECGLYYGYQWRYYKKDRIDPIKSKSEIISEIKRKPVYRYRFDGYFDKKYDYLEQVEEDGFSYKNVSRTCNRITYSCGGYQWSYEYYEKIEPYNNIKYHGEKTVYQYSLNGDFITSYISVTEAANKNNLNVKNISKACKTNNSRCGNYMWFYEFKGNKINPYHYTHKLKQKKEGTHVLQYKNGVLIAEFVSINDASKTTGIKYYKIKNSCENGTTIDDYYFKYA